MKDKHSLVCAIMDDLLNQLVVYNNTVQVVTYTVHDVMYMNVQIRNNLFMLAATTPQTLIHNIYITYTCM